MKNNIATKIKLATCTMALPILLCTNRIFVNRLIGSIKMNKFTVLILPFLFTSNVLATDVSTVLDSKPFTPETILPDGQDTTISINPYTGESGPARKGIIAATLNNIAILNKMIASGASEKELQPIIIEITKLIPSLHYVGIFDMFTPQEWLTSETQPGRILAGILYLESYPVKITDNVKEILKVIKAKTKYKILIKEISKLGI